MKRIFKTSLLLHNMNDQGISVVDWMATHPGDSDQHGLGSRRQMFYSEHFNRRSSRSFGKTSLHDYNQGDFCGASQSWGDYSMFGQFVSLWRREPLDIKDREYAALIEEQKAIWEKGKDEALNFLEDLVLNKAMTREEIDKKANKIYRKMKRTIRKIKQIVKERER